MRPYQRGRGRGRPRGSSFYKPRGRGYSFKSRGRRIYRPGGKDDRDQNYHSKHDYADYSYNDEERYDYDQEFHQELREGEDYYDHNRKRHESDTFEHLERDRYNRDEYDELDKEYDKYYNARVRNHESYRESDRDEHYDRSEDSRRHNDRYKDENERHETYRRERNKYTDYHRRNSYEHDTLYDRESQETYRHSTRRDSRDRHKDRYRSRHDSYMYDKKWDNNPAEMQDSWESSYSETIDNIPESEPILDWDANESGIKMAIEFLKNKPTYESELKENEVEEDKNETKEADIPVIKPELLNKEAIEDLVSDLLNLILKLGGEVTLKKLMEEFTATVKHRFKDESSLKSFSLKYPSVFEYDEVVEKDQKEDNITSKPIELFRAKTDVKLCYTHASHPKSCDGSCDCLHICKFYILSACSIQRCKFGHNLGDEHNIAVQQKFFLHRVELPNLCLLLQHDSNRCRVTVPVVCRYYNSMNGCRSDERIGNKPPQKCPFIHLCQQYVEGRCNIWSSCRRNHDLISTKSNVYEILCKFGLDPSCLVDGPSRVLALLQWSLNDFKGEFVKKSTRYYSDKSEETKERLKRKVEVGGDDEISVKIQRVMETEKTVDSKPVVSIAKKDSAPCKVNNEHENKKSENSNLDQATSKLNTNANEQETSTNEGNYVPTWSVQDNKKWKQVSAATITDLEAKYQKYLAAKMTTILLDGKYFKVDFSKFEGSYSGSSAIVPVQRKLVKESEIKQNPLDSNAN